MKTNLRNQISALLEVQGNCYVPVPFLVGAPGTGKSAILREIAHAKGWNVRVVPVQAPPEDFVGIPKLGEKSFEYMASPIITEMLECKEPTLFIFDELNAAHPKTMVTFYQLFNEREWQGRQISGKAKIAATGNLGEEDGTESVVEEMPSALRERLWTIRWDLDFDAWSQWIIKKYGDNMVVTFLKSERKYFNAPEMRDEFGAPSPRSWEFVISMSQHIELGIEELKGIIGTRAAVAFGTWVEEMSKITWVNILKDPKLIDMINDTNAANVATGVMDWMEGREKVTKKEAILLVRACEKMPIDLVGGILTKAKNMAQPAKEVLGQASREFNGGDNRFRNTLKKIISSI